MTCQFICTTRNCLPHSICWPKICIPSLEVVSLINHKNDQRPPPWSQQWKQKSKCLSYSSSNGQWEVTWDNLSLIWSVSITFQDHDHITDRLRMEMEPSRPYIVSMESNGRNYDGATNYIIQCYMRIMADYWCIITFNEIISPILINECSKCFVIFTYFVFLWMQLLLLILQERNSL